MNGVNIDGTMVAVTSRTSYHHGDLRTALVEAGVAAARLDGATGVGLNRLAASVGVSPAAAYRHFAGGIEELLVAIGDVARRELADLVEQRVDQTPAAGDERTTALRRLRAAGYAYVEYVVANPGLFEVACRHDRGRDRSVDPFALLRQRIDALAEAGALRHESDDAREEAALAAWATVHGLSLLLTAGPLRRLPTEGRHAVVERTLTMVEDGLARP